MFDRQKEKLAVHHTYLKVKDHLWANQMKYQYGAAGFGLGVLVTLALKSNTNIDVTLEVANY